MNKLQIISNDCENYNYNNNYNINDLMLLLVKFENYIEILNNIILKSIKIKAPPIMGTNRCCYRLLDVHSRN